MPYAKDMENPIKTHKVGPGNKHEVATESCPVASSKPNSVVNAASKQLQADDRASDKANAAFADARPRRSLDQVTNVK